MTKEEALTEWVMPAIRKTWNEKKCDEILKALAQEPCDMTAEEYRQRMIQAFHNADYDELIAVCVLPTEKEFEHLEWLLKTHYKKEPCENEERQFFEVMEFPETFNEFAEQYGFADKEEYYTNGSQLIPVFRVKQWLEHKALEQESCEDAVSREAVEDIVMWYDGQGEMLDEIQKLPSVQPKQKTGHWIRVTNGRGGHECDLCHEYAPSYQSGDEWLTKYCPNCGAKMVEPQESEVQDANSR